LLGDAVAADQLHDLYIHTHDTFGTRHIEIGHHRDFNASTCTALDFFLVTFEHFERAAAYSANA
jgi:hypothetical protein